GGCDVRCPCNERRRGRLAWYPTPCTLWGHRACHLVSQACQPLAVPRVFSNLKRHKPSATVRPTRTGFAFFCNRDRAERTYKALQVNQQEVDDDEADPNRRQCGGNARGGAPGHARDGAAWPRPPQQDSREA